MAQTILAYGEILWDILPDKRILGGAPFNFVFRTNTLGDNGLIVSSLGNDNLGEQARAQVRALGVDTSLLQKTDNAPTGTVEVTFDENHMPDYVINPNAAYDFIQSTETLIQAAIEAECICFGTLIQRAPKSRQTLRAVLNNASNAVKFLDINLRKKCYTKETILYKANILKLNDDEALMLRDMLGLFAESSTAFCRSMINLFKLDYVLITFGEFGALAQSAFSEEIYVPGYEIDVADSVGAGDAFSAAFVHHILSGHSLQTACEYSNAMGALAAMTHGGTAPISQNDMAALLQANKNRLVHPEFC